MNSFYQPKREEKKKEEKHGTQEEHKKKPLVKTNQPQYSGLNIYLALLNKNTGKESNKCQSASTLIRVYKVYFPKSR